MEVLKMKKMFLLAFLIILFAGACGSPEDSWLATMEARPTPDIPAGIETHQARLTESAPPSATPSATPEPTQIIELICICPIREWPTPYPDAVKSAGISAEICEEYRYVEDDVFPMFDELWDEEAKEWAEDYELVRFIGFLTTRLVASHTCSLYDSSYDDDHFFWSQHAYKYIEILEYRLYDEKYSK